LLSINFGALEKLESSSNPLDFYNFIATFGTHIITGTKVGGQLHYTSEVSTCSFENSNDLKASIGAFGKTIEGMITTGVETATFQSVTIERAEGNACGGDSSVFLSPASPGENPWSAWSKTIYNSTQGNCAFDFEIISISSLARSQTMKSMLETAIVSYVDHAFDSNSSKLEGDALKKDCQTKKKEDAATTASTAWVIVIIVIGSVSCLIIGCYCAKKADFWDLKHQQEQ
jgi:hypothetical protein